MSSHCRPDSVEATLVPDARAGLPGGDREAGLPSEACELRPSPVLRLLLIEDDERVQCALVAALRYRGYHVTGMTNGTACRATDRLDATEGAVNGVNYSHQSTRRLEQLQALMLMESDAVPSNDRLRTNGNRARTFEPKIAAA